MSEVRTNLKITIEAEDGVRTLRFYEGAELRYDIATGQFSMSDLVERIGDVLHWSPGTVSGFQKLATAPDQEQPE